MDVIGIPKNLPASPFCCLLRRDTVLRLISIGIVLCCGALIFSSGCINPGGDDTPSVEPTAPVTTQPLTTSWTSGPGNVYHVAVAGSDTNAGTQDRPWNTIQHAVDTAAPGDTVYVHGGEYTENVAITVSGQDGGPITLMAAPGEPVTIHGELGLRKGVSYYRLQGMSLDRYNPWGLTLWGGNHHVQIAGMEMTGGDAGIRMTYGASGEPPADGPVSDVTVEDTVVRDVLYTGVDCTPGPCDRVVFRRIDVAGSGLQESYGADGIAVERGRDILVEDSSIHDNGGDGIDLNSRDTAGNVPNVIVRRNEVYRNHLSGIKLWSGGLIERNVVWDQGEGPIVGGDFPCTMEIRENSVGYNGYDPEFGTRGYGLVVGYSEAKTGPAVRLRLVNNIVAFTSRPEGDGPTGIYLGPGVQLVEEWDNVFYSREDGEIFAQFLCDPETDYDTCDIGRNEILDGTWARLTGQGQGDLSVDPLFVSPWPDLDLHLEPGSPAAGRGAYG
ncbi:MAG: right-handed parallel beta-helix repeat-containing protein [Methanomicrobiales archaeon]|nr:right-handed parallel beta-helix repeat-containing protein [Methanomicrobiales archaeon]